MGLSALDPARLEQFLVLKEYYKLDRLLICREFLNLD